MPWGGRSDGINSASCHPGDTATLKLGPGWRVWPARSGSLHIVDPVLAEAGSQLAKFVPSTVWGRKQSGFPGCCSRPSLCECQQLCGSSLVAPESFSHCTPKHRFLWSFAMPTMRVRARMNKRPQTVPARWKYFLGGAGPPARALDAPREGPICLE